MYILINDDDMDYMLRFGIVALVQVKEKDDTCIATLEDYKELHRVGTFDDMKVINFREPNKQPKLSDVY